jgi:hypothetical protein
MTAALERLRRVTDLFVEGTEVVVRGLPQRTSDPEPVLVWVNKLNSFEMEEARKDAQVARSRLVMALRDVGSDEMALFQSNADTENQASIIAAMIAAKASTFFVSAMDSIKSDPDWSERMEILLRPTPAGEELSQEELDLLAKLNTDYTTELTERIRLERESTERELLVLPMELLREQYAQQYRDSRGAAAWNIAFTKSQTFFALRQCEAVTQGQDGRWDHSPCDHNLRMLATRDQVSTLPNGLLASIQDAITQLNMERDQARFSAGQRSSSESSPQPSVEAVSLPSTQEETSPEPAGISA